MVRPSFLPWLAAFAAVAGVLLAKAARAQYSSYEAQYGQAVDVSIDDLLLMPESYRGQSVRTRGQLEMLPSLRGTNYSLRGRLTGRVVISPMPEAASNWEMEARTWLGREVEVTGIVGTGADPEGGGAQAVYLSFWSFVGPPDDKEAAPAAAQAATLEELVTRAGRFDGKRVTVRGQFRGQNLFGDLPSSSRRRSSDWVIKDDLFAVWVTGKKPKGSGWEFDPGLKRDTGKWLEVTGRVTSARGVVTIEASQLVLSKPPTPVAQAAPPPPAPPRPKRPPVVSISLPLDGERDVPPNTVFKVQFSKDIDEPSLKDHVVLRYAGRPQPGDRELDSVKIDYEAGLRTLNIDPGDLLRAGRVVEIVLLPGIVDLEGLPLEPRPSRSPGPGVDVLRFQIAAGGYSSR